MIFPDFHGILIYIYRMIVLSKQVRRLYMEQFDVLVIGAGVVGSAIARELTRFKLKIGVLEKNLDV